MSARWLRLVGLGGLRPSHAAAAEAIRPAVDLEVRFEFDSAELTPMAQAVLDNLATALTTDLAPYRFVLEGHTDAVGSDVYNLELSERRARAARRYLLELYRIVPERMTGQGRARAAAAGATDGGAKSPRARDQSRLTIGRVLPAASGAAPPGVTPGRPPRRGLDLA